MKVYLFENIIIPFKPSILQSETDLPSELKFALDEENEGQNESFSPLTGVDSDEENVPSQISEVSQIVRD
jgi:hypothetical protein